MMFSSRIIELICMALVSGGSEELGQALPPPPSSEDANKPSDIILFKSSCFPKFCAQAFLN